MSSQLLRSRRFAPLFWCQAFAAFCDSYFKSSLLILVMVTMPKEAGWLNQLATALVMAPSFVLSALGGEMADRYDKGLIARRLKMAEFGAVALAILGFYLASLPLLLTSLFCFGIVVALFSPLKYGIIPDLVATRDVATGNALVEGATFIAVIAGALIGSLSTHEGAGVLWFAGLIAGSSALCVLASFFIPRVGEAAPQLRIQPNVLRSTGHLLAELWADTRLWRGGIIVSMFWLIGSVVMTLLPTLVAQVMGGSPAVINVYFVLFAAGIGLGSALASWLLGGRTLLLPVPLAAILLGFVALDLGWTLWGYVPAGTGLSIADFFKGFQAWHVGIDLLLLAICGGLFVVPSFAAVQIWAEPAHRARIVAAVNVLNAAFMVAGAVAVALLQMAGVSMGGLFLIIGVLAFVAAAWIFAVLPVNPLRDLSALVFRVFYGLEVHGIENVANLGSNAVFVANHVSYLDAAVLFGVLDKQAVFAIDTVVAKQWWVKPFLKYVNAKPLDPTSPLATRTLIQETRNGQSIIIFPEGRLTRTGSLMKIYDGAAVIAAKSGLPIVPVRIEGTEPTRFSFLTDQQVRRRWFNKIKVTVLPPRHLAIDDNLRGRHWRNAAGVALSNVMTDMVFETSPTNLTLFEAIVDAAKEHGRDRIALEDPTGRLTYSRLLIGAHVLGRKLSAYAAPGKAIGVMLPAASGAAVTMFGLFSAGRVAAMVNFTAGALAIKAAGQVACFDTIVTSRAFIEKAKLQALTAELEKSFKLVYLDDVRATVTTKDKIAAYFGANRPIMRRAADDPAVILFTSGTEGAPKGVALSHRNFLSNAAQIRAVIDFGREDKVFNVLPIFHAFGLTGGLFIPLIYGAQSYLYPSPLHYRIVPELTYISNATVLFGTDTFLTGYARVANPYDFRSLRFAVAGAEPLRASTRSTWMDKFGVRILEGYGVTEGAPVLAVNTLIFNKVGSVGRFVPGLESRLESVEGLAHGGRLQVRGPNVMLGYLNSAAPGEIQPLTDGWYDTGDVVALDEQGFVTIAGRAKRFAKIAGEMVSLAAVESHVGALWTDSISAAATLPDPRRGERIVLVTNKVGASRQELAAFMRSRGASDLLVPVEIYVLPEVPLLGSGKIDFGAVGRLVRERAAAQPEELAEEADEDEEHSSAA